MTVRRGLLLCYVAFSATLVGLTLFAPFLGDGVGLLALLLFFTAVPLVSLAIVAQALWRPNRRKVGAAAGALAAAALAFVLALGPAQAVGESLFFRVHRGALEALARGVLSDRRAPAGTATGYDPCDAEPIRTQLTALGFLGCRAEADRVALVAGGLLNREHGFVYVRPGSRLPAPEEVTLGTRLRLGGALDDGWYTYAGH